MREYNYGNQYSRIISTIYIIINCVSVKSDDCILINKTSGQGKVVLTTFTKNYVERCFNPFASKVPKCMYFTWPTNNNFFLIDANGLMRRNVLMSILIYIKMQKYFV